MTTYRTNPTIAISTLTGSTIAITGLPRNTRRRNTRRPAPKSPLMGAVGRFAACVVLGAILGAMLALGA